MIEEFQFPWASRLLASLLFCASVAARAETARPVDFNREIRPILSQNCFLCHGPDEKDRKGKLRLDSLEGARKGGGSGEPAIVPGAPEKSALFLRVTQTDPDELMPPPKSGKKLSAAQIESLRSWIQQGAKYATHWAYTPPTRPPLPMVQNTLWPREGLDYFILDRLEKEHLAPSPEASRFTLVRRVALDLTGLPPTLEEVDQFIQDAAPGAYERMVDRFLARETFGEHWARMWLDLARYADSAGYADDPLRTIWKYRDYVIQAFNDNKPFDEFTIEQLAGDLLPNPDEEDYVATAFHRNTMTNNEGGTNDEEFRNAAIIDRVNTTMAVWMGTSMACAQCHTHKYDPITQDEYFQFMAFLNNTEDADRPDESPTLKFFTRKQDRVRSELREHIAELEQKLATPTPDLVQSFEMWDGMFPRHAVWETLRPSEGEYHREGNVTSTDDGTISAGSQVRRIVYNLDIPLNWAQLTAFRLDPVLPAGHSVPPPKVTATLIPPNAKNLAGRFVRIELPGAHRILSLAEVQVFSGTENVAPQGAASQSSTEYEANASLAIDGKTDGDFQAKSTTHTRASENPWWELDLRDTHPVSRVVVWNRTDNKQQGRLKDFRIALLNEAKEVVWETQVTEPPNPSVELTVDGQRVISFTGQYPDGRTFLAAKPETYPEGTLLKVQIEQTSTNDVPVFDSFRLQATDDSAFPHFSQLEPEFLGLLARSDREEAETTRLRSYYIRNLAPELQTERLQLAQLTKELEGIKPGTVPIMRELAGDQRRVTHLQFRGNYLDTGREESAAVPAAFNPLPHGAPTNRLGMAEWLVARENPLTARVLANRLWEQIFGIGIVRTSEEFGSQGEPPSHPELLDWLAVELEDSGWDIKHFLRTLVTSAAYRQSSRVTPDLEERDPDNRLLARGPRFRISAETIRDQALAIGGLLSHKMYGPSVKPPRPASGLSAAFGSSVDWKTSEGQDRYRRGLYTEWRRTSPYPSMSTFDAPNREVCTLRRTRTSTPLQALVTLNDPVYLEAAQGLARRMAGVSGNLDEQLTHGFRLCVARPPSDRELSRLKAFFEEAASEYRNQPAKAQEILASNLTLPAPDDPAEMAALTTVANVLLNLDETLMKR